MSPQGYTRAARGQIRRYAPDLAADVALMARGAILWDIEDDDPGPRPWWCRIAEGSRGDPCPGVTEQR